MAPSPGNKKLDQSYSVKPLTLKARLQPKTLQGRHISHHTTTIYDRFASGNSYCFSKASSGTGCAMPLSSSPAKSPCPQPNTHTQDGNEARELRKQNKKPVMASSSSEANRLACTLPCCSHTLVRTSVMFSFGGSELISTCSRSRISATKARGQKKKKKKKKPRGHDGAQSVCLPTHHMRARNALETYAKCMQGRDGRALTCKVWAVPWRCSPAPVHQQQHSSSTKPNNKQRGQQGLMSQGHTHSLTNSTLHVLSQTSS